MKASELNTNHLGQRMTVTIGYATVKDTLTGIRAEADLIHCGSIFGERPEYALGRTRLTLEFMTAGEVKVDREDEVTIHG